MAWDGQLNTNKIFASLFNMVISLQVFTTGIEIASGGIYQSRKVDGTLFGDTKVYISTDALKSYEWDGSDTPGSYNLLTIKRPPAPVEQELVIDIFRQIPVTVDEYLTKQAFLDEGSFGSFNGVILAWLTTTKVVYEHTTYTADILVSAQAKATSLGVIALGAPTTTLLDLDKGVWKAQELYKQIEDAMKELEEPSRVYNDNSFLRTYKFDDFDIVVPLGVLSSVKKLDIPFLYGPDDKPIFKEIHWKYFGAILATSATLAVSVTAGAFVVGDTYQITSAGTTDFTLVGASDSVADTVFIATGVGTGTGTASSNRVVRALVEKDYTVDSVVTHCFPGDLLPPLATHVANEIYTATYSTRPSISSDLTILVIHKQDFPIMSAFTVGTSFFNARRLDMNHYLTFGHNPVYDAHLGERALLKFTTTNVDAT